MIVGVSACDYGTCFDRRGGIQLRRPSA